MRRIITRACIRALKSDAEVSELHKTNNVRGHHDHVYSIGKTSLTQLLSFSHSRESSDVIMGDPRAVNEETLAHLEICDYGPFSHLCGHGVLVLVEANG